MKELNEFVACVELLNQLTLFIVGAMVANITPVVDHATVLFRVNATIHCLLRKNTLATHQAGFD